MIILRTLILHGFAMQKMSTWCWVSVHLGLFTVPKCSCEGTKYVKIIIETCNVSVNERKKHLVCRCKINILITFIVEAEFLAQVPCGTLN